MTHATPAPADRLAPPLAGAPSGPNDALAAPADRLAPPLAGAPSGPNDALAALADRLAPPLAGAPSAPNDAPPAPAAPASTAHPAPAPRPGWTTAHRLAAVATLIVLAVAGAVGLGGGDGLAAAGGDGLGGGGRPAAAAIRTIELSAHHSRFTPASVDVAPGTTVRFVIRNLDPIDHEFIIGGPEVHRHHAVGRDAHHHGEVPGEISVPTGETVSTTWTAPTAPGPVTYACHLPGHLAYGMAGVVRVTS